MRGLIGKFNADRGPHLAAMIAYFALLSFFPLMFLALALLGLAGNADEDSFFVTELQQIFPGASIEDIVRTVRTVQDNAATLGIVGGAILLWTSLSLFSVLESALNIVYARPNRSFLRGKALAVVFMLGSLVTLFVGLLIGSVGGEVLKRFAPGFVANSIVAHTVSVVVSTLAVFLFLFSAYYRLTNAPLTVEEVLPGTILATLLLQASFQALPTYVRLSTNVPAAQAFGGPVILLVWLYVMSNVIVFGAEVNWWLGRGRREAVRGEDAAAGLA